MFSTLYSTHFGFQHLFLCRMTDVPSLTLILDGVGERVSYVDQVCYGCEKSAELGDTFNKLRVYHISGNMHETCCHLGTYWNRCQDQ